MALSIDCEIITPAIARKIVADNSITAKGFKHRERKMIDLYAADMSSSAWRINGDSLIFDVDGNLVDGRKRLLACIESGVPFLTYVVRGVDRDVRQFIDQQKRRTDRDMVHVAGFDDADILVSVVSAIVDIGRTGLPSQKVLPRTGYLKFLRARRDIHALIDEVADVPLAPFSRSDLTAILYLTRIVDREASDEFFGALRKTMTQDAEDAPRVIARLAQVLVRIRKEIEEGASGGGSKTRYAVVVHTIRAWNAWRTNGAFKAVGRNFHVTKSDAARIHGLPDNLFDELFKAPPPRSRSDLEMSLKEARDTLVAQVECIEPSEAMQIVHGRNGPSHNGRGRNRVRSTRDVEAYGRDMLAQRWRLTGQSIKFSKDGRLLDGQHRLDACARFGVPLVSVVVRGLEEDVFDTFDIAHQHTLASHLDEEGVENSLAMQNSLRYLFFFREVGLGVSAPLKPSRSELDEVAVEYPRLPDFIEEANAHEYAKFRFPVEHLATLMTVLHGIDREKADEFFRKLAIGAGMKADHPVALARKALAGVVADKALARSPWPRIYLLCRAWIAFHEGKKVRIPKRAKEIAALRAPAPFDQGAAPRVAPRSRKTKSTIEQASLPFDTSPTQGGAVS